MLSPSDPDIYNICGLTPRPWELSWGKGLPTALGPKKDLKMNELNQMFSGSKLDFDYDFGYGRPDIYSIPNDV